MLWLTGCASAAPLMLHRVGSGTTCITPAPEADLLIGIALSGGGSRAAVFGAAGLEALGRLRAPGGGSLLEETRYLSSVSGGSVAGAYYASHKPPKEISVLTPQGDYTSEYQAFFKQYRERLAQDFERALIWRQLGSFRWLNSALAARSLQEVLQEKLLGDTTLGALSARLARGDIPAFMFNASLFNDGRRLIMTTMPQDVARYDIFADLRRAAAGRNRTVEFVPLTQRMWEGLMAVTPLDLRVDPCPVPVAGAVAASASFPPLVGPITFRVQGEPTYWHAGDGGLYENAGVETLASVFLKKLQDGKARRALIISLDSSYPFAVAERLLGRRSAPFSILTYDFSRIPGIMEQRAYAYHHLFIRSLRLEGVVPDPNAFRIMYLGHTDPPWQGDLSDLPDACRGQEPPLRTPLQITEHLAEIPTRLKIFSECDRQLLVTSANKVVAQAREEIEAFLAGQPFPERTAR
ncbi:MAG: patatin-like phospholipase family protein [Candidatus Rokuibacteriota bacterium]